MLKLVMDKLFIQILDNYICFVYYLHKRVMSETYTLTYQIFKVQTYSISNIAINRRTQFVKNPRDQLPNGPRSIRKLRKRMSDKLEI